MKPAPNFLGKAILIAAAAAIFAACGDPVAPNQNANLAQNQNANSLAAQKNSPTASPTELPVIVQATPRVPTPTPAPNIQSLSPPTISNSSDQNSETAGNNKLIIPVQGVKPEQLRDTFNDARGEGRVHDAIDIMAPGGTPVVAAADGEIARFFDSVKGGITIYQYSADKKLIYYYAHLQRRADDLQEHQYVKQGTVIGYVGDTGNAGAGNTHLHFAIWTITDPKRFWDGTNINPYPLLRQ